MPDSSFFQRKVYEFEETANAIAIAISSRAA